MNKFVQIDPIVKVMLVPSRKEYYDAKLGNKIWYNNHELDNITKAVSNKIKTLTCFFHGDMEKAKSQWKKNFVKK